MRLNGVELARIDLSEVRDERRGSAPFSGDRALDGGKEVTIVEGRYGR